MRFAPGSLAVVAPEWLLARSDAEWVERSGHRIEESRLPTSEGDRLALAEVMGKDGWKVLSAVFDPLAPSWLREIPAIRVLRQIWVQNYGMEDGQLRWREADNIPPATLAHQLTVRDDKPTWAKSAVLSGLVTCAASVQMKFLLEAGEVESKITSRTMTYLEGKPEEDSSMSIKQRVGEGMYTAARAASCAHG